MERTEIVSLFKNTPADGTEIKQKEEKKLFLYVLRHHQKISQV